MSQDHFSESFAHFSFCALLAVEIARISGEIGGSRPAQHKFLMLWLGKAIKQKRFSRLVQNELLILQKLGRQQGQLAKIKERLEQITSDYLTVKANLTFSEKSFIRRLYDACDSLGRNGWTCEIGLDRDWKKDGPLVLPENTVFCIKEHLIEGFDDEGTLLHPINIFVVGEPQIVVDEFYFFGLLLFPKGTNIYQGKTQTQYDIWPKNKGPSLAATPTHNMCERCE